MAEITESLLAFSKMCGNGACDVLRRRDHAYRLDPEHRVMAKFVKKNGLYMVVLDVQNPAHSGFTRQER